MNLRSNWASPRTRLDACETLATFYIRDAHTHEWCRALFSNRYKFYDANRLFLAAWEPLTHKYKRLFSLFQPKPIVDTIQEEDKYGNTGDKFYTAGRAIVGGASGVSNLVNSILEVCANNRNTIITFINISQLLSTTGLSPLKKIFTCCACHAAIMLLMIL